MTKPSVPPRPVRQVPKDLRAYIDALDEIGELQRIDAEVSLDYELGAIVRRSYDLMAPAPLFTNITGVTPGFRVLGAPAGVSAQPGLYLSRVALSLGLDPRATGSEIVAALVEARDATPIPPRIVSTGPCKEVVATGGDVDLGRLPAPLLHGHDGGQVPQHLRDHRRPHAGRQLDELVDLPDAVHGRAPHVRPRRADPASRGHPRDVARARRGHAGRGRDRGSSRRSRSSGGMPLPEGVNEADFIGAYLGEPIDVVRCETVDLEVPATAEIVIEGMLSTSEVAPKGRWASSPGSPIRATTSRSRSTT